MIYYHGVSPGSIWLARSDTTCCATKNDSFRCPGHLHASSSPPSRRAGIIPILLVGLNGPFGSCSPGLKFGEKIS